MNFQILKCTLKKEKADQTFVNFERRSHDVEFEIRNPGKGVQKNVEKLCDVVVVEMTATQEMETKELLKKNIKHDPELLQFAIDSWDLAVELEAEVAELKSAAVEISVEDEVTDVIEEITPEKIETKTESEAVPEAKKETKETKETKKRTRKPKKAK